MTNYTAYTAWQLLDLGRSAQVYFEETLGYDEARFVEVSLRPSGDNNIQFSLTDDFQDGLSNDQKYKVGWAVFVPLDGFWDKLTTWPNREQRELTILARKVAAIDGNLDQIKSAQVLAFVARLQPDIDALRAQIEDMSGNTVEIS